MKKHLLPLLEDPFGMDVNVAQDRAPYHSSRYTMNAFEDMGIQVSLVYEKTR